MLARQPQFVDKAATREPIPRPAKLRGLSGTPECMAHPFKGRSMDPVAVVRRVDGRARMVCGGGDEGVWIQGGYMGIYGDTMG